MLLENTVSLLPLGNLLGMQSQVYLGGVLYHRRIVNNDAT